MNQILCTFLIVTCQIVNILPLIQSHCTKKSESETVKKPADSYFSMHRGLTRITKKYNFATHPVTLQFLAESETVKKPAGSYFQCTAVLYPRLHTFQFTAVLSFNGRYVPPKKQVCAWRPKKFPGGGDDRH
jgi:hypothetical protein